MRERRRRLDAKASLLKGMQRGASAAAAAVDESDSTAAEWDALLAGLARFESNLEAQKGTLAQQVAGDVERLKQQVAGVQARWLEAKPAGMHFADVQPQWLQDLTQCLPLCSSVC